MKTKRGEAMIYQVKDENDQLLDAHFEIDDTDLIFHSRGGTKGKDVRNLDYSNGLRLLLKRIQEGRVVLLGVWVDSARVQGVPLEERRILDESESGASPENLLTLLSTRMKSIGRDPDAREGGGNPTIFPEPLVVPFNLRVYSGAFGYLTPEQALWFAAQFPVKIEGRRSLELPSSMPPERRERLREEFQRDRRHVTELKDLYQGRCQISGEPPLGGTAGDITEGHHIEWLTREGVDGPDNIVILSPDWHRAIHAADAKFDWKKLCFVLGGQEIPLKLNNHLKQR